MSRVATIELLYQSDFGKARQEYLAWKEYVESNPPKVDVKLPGQIGGPARTFGGNVSASGAGSIATSAQATGAPATVITNNYFGARGVGAASIGSPSGAGAVGETWAQSGASIPTATAIPVGNAVEAETVATSSGSRRFGPFTLGRGLGAAFFAIHGVRSLARAAGQLVSNSLDEDDAQRFGAAEQRLGVAEREARADNFDSFRRMIGQAGVSSSLTAWGQDSNLSRVLEARESLRDVAANSRRIGETTQGKRTTESLLAEARITDIRSPFERRNAESRQALTERENEITDRVADLKRQISDSTDTHERARLNADLEAYQKQAPSLLSAARAVNFAARTANQFDVSQLETRLSYRGPELAALQEGSFGRAGELQFIRSQREQLLDTDPALRGLIGRQQSQERFARVGVQDENISRQEAADSIARSRLGGNSLRADLAETAESRRQAFKDAPFRDVRFPLNNAGDDLKYNQRLTDEINTRFDTQAAADRAGGYRRQIGIGLGTGAIENQAAEQRLRNRQMFRTATVGGFIGAGVNEIEQANVDLPGTENARLRTDRIAAIRSRTLAQISGQTDPLALQYQSRAEVVSPFVMRGDRNNLAFQDYNAAKVLGKTAPGALDDAANGKGGPNQTPTQSQVQQLITLLTQLVGMNQ